MEIGLNCFLFYLFLLYLKTVAWDREKNYKEITETQIKKQGKQQMKKQPWGK